MKLLEKQKEQKSRLKSQEPSSALPAAVPAPVESNFENLTVVIQNENRTIQTNKALPTVDDTDKNPSQVLKVANNAVASASNKSPSIASNTSLAKKVLVKNAIDSLNTPKVTDNSKHPAHDIAKLASVKPSNAALATQPKKTAPAPASTDGKETTAKAKPIVMSLAMFAKKTAKERAIVLANYVKRYRTQGFVYDCTLAKSRSIVHYVLFFVSLFSFHPSI